MSTEAQNPVAELRELIADGSISVDALLAITGIPADNLLSQPLSADERTRLATLAAQLTEGLRIGADERLTGILESLTVECRLTPQNIAQLTGIDTGAIETALRDPHTVPIQTRYELALAGSYLINAVNQARGR